MTLPTRASPSAMPRNSSRERKKSLAWVMERAAAEEDLDEAFQHHVEAGPARTLREHRLAGLHLDQESPGADVIERGGRQGLEDHRARENVPIPFLAGDLHRGPILEQNGSARRARRGARR